MRVVLAGANSAVGQAILRLGAQEWEPEIESARQTYRMLAEADEAKGDQESAHRHREDLESVIRLARMALVFVPTVRSGLLLKFS